MHSCCLVATNAAQFAALLGMCLVVHGGCSGNRNETVRARLQLNWLPDAQHGGFVAADVHAYDQEEGWEIEILAGGPGIDSLPKLVLGQAEFAVANADQVLLARAQDADVVAVFAAMHQNPRCIMVHRSSGIDTFEQLNGLVLALGEGRAFAEYLKQRLPLGDVRIVPYSGTIAKWLLEPNFAQQAYVFSEPVLARQRGGDPHVLMVSDLGFNPYSTVLVTTSRMIREQPERVAKVVRAVARGWEKYLQDPSATNQRLVELSSPMDLPSLTEAAEAIRPLCVTPAGVPLGLMKLERWEELHQQLVELGMLNTSRADAAAAFTNRFLGE